MNRMRYIGFLAATLSSATILGASTAQADPGRSQADYTYLTTLHLKIGVPIGDSEADYDRVIAQGHGICKDLQTAGNPTGEAQVIFDRQFQKVTRDQATRWVQAASIAYCPGQA